MAVREEGEGRKVVEIKLLDKEKKKDEKAGSIYVDSDNARLLAASFHPHGRCARCWAWSMTFPHGRNPHPIIVWRPLSIGYGHVRRACQY
jgi:hypothetical protein